MGYRCFEECMDSGTPFNFEGNMNAVANRSVSSISGNVKAENSDASAVPNRLIDIERSAHA